MEKQRQKSFRLVIAYFVLIPCYFEIPLLTPVTFSSEHIDCLVSMFLCKIPGEMVAANGRLHEAFRSKDRNWLSLVVVHRELHTVLTNCL